MRETVTAAGIAQDYNNRSIQPDSVVNVKQGYLRLWIWCNLYVAELYIDSKDLKPGTVIIRGQTAYRNTASPQDIADDLITSNKLSKPDILTVSDLGRLGGAAKTEAKQTASRENGKKGGRPKKTEQIKEV